MRRGWRDGLWIEQAALVELAVDLDQQIAKLAQQGDANRHIVGERAAAAVGGHDPAQEQLALEGDRAVLQQRLQLGCRRRLELRHHGSLLGAGADQGPVGASAQCQAQRIQDDRLAGTGLASEHGQAAGKAELEPLDQDDVMDREALQHRRLSGRSVAPAVRTRD